MLHSVKRLADLFAVLLALCPAFVFGQFQVRMEAFNAFNRTRFDRAGAGWGGGSFGRVNALARDSVHASFKSLNGWSSNGLMAPSPLRGAGDYT